MKGHSERIKNKNLKNLAGKPLCFWILETLTACNFKEIIINTDSEDIAIETKKYFSPKRFGIDLIRFHSLSISLMNAFKTNNNKLNHSELGKAVKKADSNTTKEFKDKEVFVLTDE